MVQCPRSAPSVGAHPAKVLARLAGREWDAGLAERRGELGRSPGPILAQERAERGHDLRPPSGVQQRTRPSPVQAGSFCLLEALAYGADGDRMAPQVLRDLGRRRTSARVG